MKVLLNTIIILLLCAVVKMSEAMSENECIEFKEKYLKNDIDILELRVENSRLRKETHFLRKQNAEFLAERENCTVISENVDEISASLTSIQENLLPLKMHLESKVKSSQIQREKENSTIDDFTRAEQLLNELKNISDNFTLAAGQFNEISDRFNDSLNGFEVKLIMSGKLEIVNDLMNTTESDGAQAALKDRAQAALTEIRLVEEYLVSDKVVSLPVERDVDYWLVVLRRIDGTVNFQRSWQDYKVGFGDIVGNYFMGLDKLFQLTSAQCYELKVVLEDFNSRQSYALYDKFAIASEDESYALHTLGNNRGTAGDGLRNNLGMKFTTSDRDNDEWNQRNCAVEYDGAWWHKVCSYSKLTGIYIPGGKDPSHRGIKWNTTDAPYSFKTAKMMIRRYDC